MISRQTLYEVRARMKKEAPGFNEAAREVVLMLVDQCLTLEDKINGGAAQRDWATERARSDRQVRYALDDLRKVIAHSPRGTYVLDCVDKMLKAKLSWAREWSYYQPMIKEEFGDE
jgi:hypothetical protein